jgi:MFS family permease
MVLDLLRLREFRAYLVANSTERLAAAGMTVLLGFQIYAIRHNPLDLGLIGLVEAIPGVSLVLYGGHIADQHSRRRIVLITTGTLTVLAACLAFGSAVAPGYMVPLLFVVAFLSACARAFETPAASGLEAQILPLDKVMRGVPILASVARSADVVGPVVGGFLWAALGATATYAILSALFATTCLLLLTQIADKPITHRQTDGLSVTRRIAEGVRFVFRSQVLFGSMALDLFAVFFGGATALLPVFATDILHAGSVGFGLLRSAAAAGSLVSAVLATRFMPKRNAGIALHAVIAGFGVATIVFGFSTNLLISLVALFIAGVCDGLSMVIRQAIMRLAAPDHLRGRVAAVRMVFVGSSNELGALESGFAASLFGTTAAVWGGGVVTLGVVAVVALVAPQLWRLNLLAMIANQPPQPIVRTPAQAIEIAEAAEAGLDVKV